MLAPLWYLPFPCALVPQTKKKKKCLVLDIRFSTVISHRMTFDSPQPNSSISHYPHKALLFVVEITGVHGVLLRNSYLQEFSETNKKCISLLLAIFLYCILTAAIGGNIFRVSLLLHYIDLAQDMSKKVLKHILSILCPLRVRACDMMREKGALLLVPGDLVSTRHSTHG